MKRKIFLGLLVVVMCFALVGCGTKKASTDSKNNSTKTDTQTYVNKVGEMFTVTITFKFENDKPVSGTVDTTYAENYKTAVDVLYNQYQKDELYKDVTKDEYTVHCTYTDKGMDSYKNLNKEQLQEALRQAGYELKK